MNLSVFFVTMRINTYFEYTISFLLYTFGPFVSGIKKNPLKSVGMIFLLSILFFVMFFLLMFQSFTENSIGSAKEKIDIVFFLEKNIPEHKEDMIKAQLNLMKKKIRNFSVSIYFSGGRVANFFKKISRKIFLLEAKFHRW